MKTNKIRLMGAALFISLSINIFMAGTVAGSSASTFHKSASDAEAQDTKLRENLSDADKLVLKEAMDANREKVTDAYNEVQDMKKDIMEVVKKEPMDEKTLDAVLQKEKNKKLALVWLVHETRQAAMKKMSPEGRVILAKVGRLGFDLDKRQCR